MPSLEFFSCIYNTEEIIFDLHEHYVKQSYRNRCYIVTANNVASLTIPVKEGTKKIKYKDILVDYDQKWLNTHWRTLISAYGKAPFFEYYAPLFEKILFKKNKFLFDVNLELLSLCLRLLKLEKKISFTNSYIKQPQPEINDIRGLIHPKKNYKSNPFYKEYNYNQIFGKNFVSNLSIIDLLFCEGGNSKQILQKSTNF